VTPPLQVVRPTGLLHRVGRVPDAWALAPWTYAGPDNTFGNRYDNPAGEYRVLYAAGPRRGAFLETLARFRAGEIRRRTPRALTQEVSRYVFERPEAFAGIHYLSRLGDEISNWAIFEGSELDAVLEENGPIEPDDPDFASALATLGLRLG
jgi:hypothetical protein